MTAPQKTLELSQDAAGQSLAAMPCYASSCGRVTLYLGDSLELPWMEADAVVTDPPYGIAYCHGARKGGRKMGTDGMAIIGDDKPYDPRPWLAWDKVVLWGMHHFAQRLPVGSVLTWIKRNDDAFGSFLSDAELAWMKGGYGVYCRRDMSMNAETATRIHPTQKPVGLMAWCMDKAKVPQGATVLDPYMGSGSTIIAAIRTGRKAIGIEKDPEHFKNAVERIKRELAQGDLFLGQNAAAETRRE